MKIKKESLNNTIDEISNNLGANSSKAKDFVNSLDDQDIKEIKKQPIGVDCFSEIFLSFESEIFGEISD